MFVLTLQMVSDVLYDSMWPLYVPMSRCHWNHLVHPCICSFDFVYIFLSHQGSGLQGKEPLLHRIKTKDPLEAACLQARHRG